MISAFKLMNLPVYNGTIFSSLFTDQNLMPIVNKNGFAKERWQFKQDCTAFRQEIGVKT